MNTLDDVEWHERETPIYPDRAVRVEPDALSILRAGSTRRIPRGRLQEVEVDSLPYATPVLAMVSGLCMSAFSYVELPHVVLMVPGAFLGAAIAAFFLRRFEVFAVLDGGEKVTLSRDITRSQATELQADVLAWCRANPRSRQRAAWAGGNRLATDPDTTRTNQ